MTDPVCVFLLNCAVTAAVIGACMISLWWLSIRLSDISIVDIFWGPAFAIVALVSYVLSNGTGVPARRLLVCGLTVVWGLRLGIHLWFRARNKGEDPRYTAAFRNRYADDLHLQTLFKVYLLQGLFAWVVSMPVQVAQFLPRPQHLGIPALVGCLLWLTGFLFEAVSDRQLTLFKHDSANRGKILDHGLWRYTRHPNYFGNACLWWGLFLLACDHWLGTLTLFAPLLMTHLLLNVTGKRLLEKRMSRARPQYAAYVRRTSGFFPWPPRKD